MQVTTIPKLVSYRRRLATLSLLRKAYYLGSTLYGEVFRRRAPGTFGLRMVEVAITEHCQCHCAHCYADARAPDDEEASLTTVELISLLDQMAAMHVTEVCFTGGEPLLRKDLIDLIAYSRGKGLLPKINTNGILLSTSMIRRLKEAGLAWCLVSIDSADARLHDALRGHPGCFEKATQGIRQLVEQGIPTSFVTCVRREVFQDGGLEAIVALAHGLGVDTIRLLFPVPVGRLKNVGQAALTLEERQEVRRRMADPIVNMECPNERSSCTAAITKMYVSANGDVTPCALIPAACGNVRRQSLREIWRFMAGFERVSKPKGFCPPCDPNFMERLPARLGRKRDTNTQTSTYRLSRAGATGGKI